MNFEIKDFLSGSRNSGKVANIDKQSILDHVQPDGAQLYNMYDSWRVAIVNSKTGSRLALKLNDIEVDKATQLAADALNKAAKALELNPSDKKAAKALNDNAPVVQKFVSELYDSPDNYVYFGETVEGRKFAVISPNAPGANTGIATISFTAEMVGA